MQYPHLLTVNNTSYLPPPTSLIGFTNTDSIVLSYNIITLSFSIFPIAGTLLLSLSVIIKLVSLLTITVGMVTSHLIQSATYVIILYTNIYY